MNIDLQKELELTVLRLVAERDALKARIEEAEKQEPTAWQWQSFGSQYGEDDHWFYTWDSQPPFISEHNARFVRSVQPLYTKPIISPDTAELIRKAREEERERILLAIPGKKFFSCSDEQWIRNLKTGFNTACDEFLESVNATINKDTGNAN